MDIFISEKIEKIMNALEGDGFEAYLVGGCVRDSVLGRTPNDFDIATSASPEEVKSSIAKIGGITIETGIRHGTVTAVVEGERAEVTTFRTDGAYIDHRHPSSVTFTDNLIDDLSRRDFTINAMAYNKKKGLVDKFGGQKDLFRHRITCVGEPAVRFNEDALRILRAMRFASALNFRIDDITAVAVHDLKRLLLDVSPERISRELDLILMGSSPADTLINFSDVIAMFIPEMRPCIGFDQHSRYHAYDVWTHTAVAIEHSAKDRDVRLALLLHDIAKPLCCKFDEEGGGHFRNHEKSGAEMAEKILARLHYPNDTITRVSQLIKFHYITPIEDKKVVKRLLGALGPENFLKLAEVMKGDSRAKQSFCFERVDVLDKMKIMANIIVSDGECYKISQLAVDGNDVAALGISGKAVGECLDKLLTMVIDDNIPNEKDELMVRARAMILSN